MKAFFEPASVAIIGASDSAGSVGRSVLDNLLAGNRDRRLYPVNPRKQEFLGVRAYPSVAAIPETPDLAIIALRADGVAAQVEECGKKGTRSVVIISAGFREVGAEGKQREEEVFRIARRHGIRIIGPNCLGVIRPSSGLNASFARKSAIPGKVAFLSQSGALGTAVLDWAVSRNIGLSAFVSLGDMIDIDFGDLIDYFGMDPETRAILIYTESLGMSLVNARKFMSAARGFARNKPIIAIKPGKFQESVAAARSHTGAMVGEDLYYQAVLNRAGVVRVEEIEDLFNAASVLNTPRLPKGPNLAIVTNAGGPAVLAVDALIARGGKLAQLSPETTAGLNEFLPAYASKANPIDVLGDASSTIYSRTLETVMKDPNVNGVIVIYTPQGMAKATEAAEVVVKAAAAPDAKPILTAFIGGEDVAAGRATLYAGGVPTFEFPEGAVKSYLYMYQYARNLEALYETPEDLPLEFNAPKDYLRVMVRRHIREGRTLLNETDSKRLLAAYGINGTIPRPARTALEAAIVAAEVGYPLVMKVASPDISHKSDVDGVKLNLRTSEDVQSAFSEIVESVAAKRPDARLEGVTLQHMVTDHDYELIVGSKKDPVLGPTILFGLGGTEAEFFKDIAIGLPPLNQVLARRILQQTKMYSMLATGFRNRPAVSLLLLDEILIRVSNLIVDFPEIMELDINPLVIHQGNAIALDARIVLDPSALAHRPDERPHLIISPYPTKYVQSWRCSDGTLVSLRPIRPEDEPLERELLANISPEASRFRFFYTIRDITHEMLVRFCNIDYDREMAIVAEYNAGGKRRIVGVGRLIVAPDEQTGEYAILIADDFQRRGLGLKISDVLIGFAQEKGLLSIQGTMLSDNTGMAALAIELGFIVKAISAEESHIELKL